MSLFNLFSRQRCKPLQTLSGNLDEVYVVTKVDGVRELASVADLVRCYQKNRHADNRMRAAADVYKAAIRNASRRNEKPAPDLSAESEGPGCPA